MAIKATKYEIEDTPDGLRVSQPYATKDIDHLGAVVISIDNGIFELIVSHLNGEGGYLVELFHCEQMVFDEGVTTNWKEILEPCVSCDRPRFDDPCEHCGHSEEFATEFGKDS